MSALTDAERYLWLLGVETVDDPIELLRAMVMHAKTSDFSAQTASNNIKLQARVVELEAELREMRKKLVANIELLQQQLNADHQHKRIQDLETKLKEAKAQTAAFRRVVVHGASEKKTP